MSLADQFAAIYWAAPRAFRLGMGKVLVPFVFAFSPSLLLVVEGLTATLTLLLLEPFVEHTRLTVRDVQDVVEAAIGGMSVSTAIAGRSRFSINRAPAAPTSPRRSCSTSSSSSARSRTSRACGT